MENILLHHYFGIKQFYVYDGGITSKLVETLSQPEAGLSSLNVAILPWNVPEKLSPACTAYIVGMDCHFRAKAQGFASNFALNLDQILVPRSGGQTVAKALKQSMKSGQVLVPVLKFCREYPEEKTQLLVSSLKQSIYNSQLSQGLHVKVSYLSGGDQVKISQDELAVHDYSDCDNFDLDANGPEAIKDKTILRQSGPLVQFLTRFFPSTQKLQ